MEEPSTPASRQRPRRFSRRAIAAAAVGGAILVAVGVILNTRPSFGPAEAAALELTLAPGVSVELLPSAHSLADAHFEAFDVSPDFAVVVSVDSTLFDLASGDKLFTDRVSVHSFAFFGEGLAVVSGSGELGYYDDGKFAKVGAPIVPNALLKASSDRTRLFFYRHTDGLIGIGNTPALASLASGAAPEMLTGSDYRIDAVGGDEYQTLFSVRDALFQIVTPGRPSLVLALPNDQETITGVAVAGTATYFATNHAVYALDEALVVPVVIGLGGDIRVVNGAIFVLEPRLGRIYRIAVGKERES